MTKSKAETQKADAAAIAAADVLATAAAVAASHRGNIIDHDALIRLQGQVENLTNLVTLNAQESAKRDAVLGEKVDKINGSVGRNEQRTSRIEDDLRDRPMLVDQHRELYSDYLMRRENKTDRQWLIPIIVSIPPSVLAAITLAAFVFYAAHQGGAP